MYIKDIEVTPREILVSIIIVLLMGSIGIWIDTKITDNFIENNSIYHKSVKIKDKDSLDYLMSTKVGNSLIEGEFNSIDGASFHEINGKYTYLEKTKQKYNRHTRRVCSGSGKKRTCRTEIYYRWDTVDRDEQYAKNIDFYGNKLNTEYVVNQSNFEQLDLSKYINDEYQNNVKNNYLYETSRIRYYYNFIPLTFEGTIFTNFSDNEKMFNKYNVYYETTIDEILTNEENSINIGGIIFKIVWVLCICVVVYMYVAAENKYLEN